LPYVGLDIVARMSTPLTRRRRPPRLRQAGATYLVSWDLHTSQSHLSEAERTMLLETIRHFDRVHFDLLAALVMENKVYVLVTPSSTRPLERTVGGWKRWASGRLGAGGRTAPFWQTGYNDRIMRGPEEVAQRIEQLKRVPERQWPGTVRYPWLWVREHASWAGDRPVEARDGGPS
jgi:hypothetical protein